MNKDKYVFAQMTEHLGYLKFRRLVGKYSGDSYVKHFTCRNQLLTLMFGQLSGRDSLRDLVTVLEAHRSKCYHLGLEASRFPATPSPSPIRGGISGSSRNSPFP